MTQLRLITLQVHMTFNYQRILLVQRREELEQQLWTADTIWQRSIIDTELTQIENAIENLKEEHY